MKKAVVLFVSFALSTLGISQTARSDDRNAATFKCVTPCDVLTRTGHYVGGVSKKMFRGAKAIVVAPFKTPMNFPQVRTYQYTPGYFQEIREK